MTYGFRSFIGVLGVLALVGPGLSVAQSRDVVPLGARMRVTTTASDSIHFGNLTSLDSVAVVLQGKAMRQPGLPTERPLLTIPLASVRKLEISRGQTRRARRTIAGSVMGLVAGAFIGGVIMAKATECDCEDSGIGVLLGVPVGAAVGLLAGGGLGYAMAPHRWESLPIPGRATR
jgi:hypothetical protein